MRKADLKVGLYAQIENELFEEDARPLDFLAAQRAEEAWNEPIHQFEVGGQRWCALVCVVEHFFPEVLGVQHGARAAVYEDEFRLQDVPLALHVGAHRNDAAASE